MSATAAPPYRARANSGDVFDDSKAPSRNAWPDEKHSSATGNGSIGFHLMNADDDDDEELYSPDSSHPHPHSVMPNPYSAQNTTMPALAAPRPGYAAPIAALNDRQASPAPSDPFNPPPSSRDHLAPRPPALARTNAIPPAAPISVPSTPHPLPPTMTPIQPVFARPEKAEPSVRFGGTPILRSGQEDTPIRRRGERGDDFWRRFSMIAKDNSSHKESKWLHETQSGKSRWSRYVWIIGLLLLACIGLGVGLGVYSHLTNKSNVQSGPKAIGGSDDHSGSLIVTPTAHPSGSGTALHVSPTYTVARRAPMPEPTGGDFVVPPVAVVVPHEHSHMSEFSHDGRRSRKRSNRTAF